jgi:hypothetical protein
MTPEGGRPIMVVVRKEDPMRTVGLVLIFAVTVTIVALARPSVAFAPKAATLPASPVTSISTVSQELVAVALPRGESGLRWRMARPFDRAIIRPLVTRDVQSLTVFVFVAERPGVTDLRFALTNGGSQAYRAARFHIVVALRK